jgi:hypothetical protein
MMNPGIKGTNTTKPFFTRAVAGSLLFGPVLLALSSVRLPLRRRANVPSGGPLFGRALASLDVKVFSALLDEHVLRAVVTSNVAPKLPTGSGSYDLGWREQNKSKGLFHWLEPPSCSQWFFQFAPPLARKCPGVFLLGCMLACVITPPGLRRKKQLPI